MTSRNGERPVRGPCASLARPALTALALSAIAAVACVAVSAAVRDVGTVTPELGEESPGGAATSRRELTDREAFAQASRGLSAEGEANFRIGNVIFRRLWVTAPASTDSADGLGPLFNARSCQGCHVKDGRGRPPASSGEASVSMVLKLSVPAVSDDERRLLDEHRVNALPEPVYGGQLQSFAVSGLDNEGRMEVAYRELPVTFADGATASIRAPSYAVAGLTLGPLHPHTMLSPRVAPQMIGLGLLAAIPEAGIRARADPDDRDGDGISGRTNEVWSLERERVMLGRFGWKAGMPTVREQTADAFGNDIGLSTTLRPRAAGDCTPAQKACIAAPHGNSAANDGVEVGDKLLDLAAFYAANLAVPPRRGARSPDVLKGKGVFHDLGCASCHVPSWRTGDAEGQAPLSNQLIWPYTDLLLHDMGEGLADNRPEGAADGREWRTPPLWGIGLTGTVSGHSFFLHDGRARNLEEAILWHGGEAQRSRDGYTTLPKSDRDALMAFLRSL